MKSDFSRFLHYALSYSGLTRISRWNKFATLFDLDTPVKPECDTMWADAATCRGRSMVEMLGVLAIIGVLSVGAIAGYSKAMMKYKLNQHAEQMNTVINAVARNTHSFGDLGAGTHLTSIFIKMGEIPVEMIKAGDTYYIYDIFGQTWRIFINSSNNTIFLQTDNSSSLRTSSADNLAICQNIFTTAKENAANIAYISTTSNYKTENAIVKMWYGDIYCGRKGSTCLRNMTLDDIYNTCTAHKGVSQPIMYQMTWNKN